MTERQNPVPVHRKYGPSQVAELTAVRESEWGIFLDAETGNTSDDILLHTMQQTAPVKVGDRVRVFLYLDPKRRLTASMRTPRMKEGQVARLRVINVTKEGAFLDVGAEGGIRDHCVTGCSSDLRRSVRSSGRSSIRISPGALP